MSIKAGLFGYGHLGKIHAKCLAGTDFVLEGIYDPSLEQSDVQGIEVMRTPEALMQKVDACIIASATHSHYELGQMALGQGKHCFIEKPMTTNIEEAKVLSDLAEDSEQLISQVGYVERFNPAFTFIQDYIQDPKFMEIHRLATFNLRGTDVSVVKDLMIHDLDLLLSFKKQEIKEIRATGVSVFTDSLDICNARIEFQDGSVANLTASRMSLKEMRKVRIFQENSYISIDLLKKESQLFELNNADPDNSFEIDLGDRKVYMGMKASGKLEGNAILEEQKHFYDHITRGEQSPLNIKSSLKTLMLAEEIERISKTN